MKRKVGEESSKSYQQKHDNGFFKKYMSGKGLDIGYAGYVEGTQPILDTAVGVDLNFPGYDGKTLPFPDASQDFVYSSHVLEHIEDYKNAIREWYRVTKVGGFIITVVPHRDLYEKKMSPPSRFNEGHLRFYTPASLLKEFEDSLPINTFRVRHLQDNDERHNYNDPPEVHGRWLYEIELVIQKIK